MKTINLNTLFLFALCLLYSCSAEESDKATSKKEVKEYLVSLKMAGEISSEDTPMSTRAATSSTDLYAIQVLKKANGSSYWDNFAEGLFDNPDDMNLYLKDDGKYNIVVSLLKNGKNLVYKQDSSYAFPDRERDFSESDMNKFRYSTYDYYDLNNLKSGKIYNGSTVNYPQCKSSNIFFMIGMKIFSTS